MDIPKRLHFVGIGGIGMSGIAKVLLEMGHEVSGSDLRLSPLTAALEALGAKVCQGHRAQNLGEVEMVVISSAVPESNEELVAARQRGIPVVKRAEVLSWLMDNKQGIAVAGSHGKTTTTSLIALILHEAGLDPLVLAGGEIPELGSNAKTGRGPHMVAEADEYDGSFLRLRPQIAVVTNVDDDHLDYYKDFGSIVNAFRSFLASVPPTGHLVVCADDPVLSGLVRNKLDMPGGPLLRPEDVNSKNVISYGFREGADWRAVQVRPNSHGGSDFEALHLGASLGVVSTAIPGSHNVLNALAALAVADLCGAPADVSKRVLNRFTGAKRRFEVKGEIGGVTIVDDYAHHPAEVEATLGAARARFESRRIVCLFQPHTYSRTKLLGPKYGGAFENADELIITEIYPAREENTWGATLEELAGHIRHKKTTLGGSLVEAYESVARILKSGDVLITMGAGDVYLVGERLLANKNWAPGRKAALVSKDNVPCLGKDKGR